MDCHSNSSGKEQRLLQNARREGLVIMAVWAAALMWSCLGSYFFGYAKNREIADIHVILGMPDWVFWFVTFPWGLCLLFSIWFCFRFMADDDLGQDQEEGPDHV
ncbi:MAG TPA: hypothetical protein VGY77_09905 [Gemmataceae bacterium]|jgi:hypothetical protein|nr:hypothetical protein [Gemmataceae bacterium]